MKFPCQGSHFCLVYWRAEFLPWLGSTVYRCVGSETEVGTENLPKFLLHVAVEQGRKVSSPGGGSRHLELTGGPPQTPHTWPKRSLLRDLGNLMATWLPK